MLNAIIYVVAALVFAVMGLLILIFRVPYSAWWNRVYKKRGTRENFTPNMSVGYGIVAIVLGVVFAIVAVPKA
jgi:multisubunit Na+/H+ antiporter MnhB subunit